jgi:hypothetical protein
VILGGTSGPLHRVDRPIHLVQQAVEILAVVGKGGETGQGIMGCHSLPDGGNTRLNHGALGGQSLVAPHRQAILSVVTSAKSARRSVIPKMNRTVA